MIYFLKFIVVELVSHNFLIVSFLILLLLNSKLLFTDHFLFLGFLFGHISFPFLLELFKLLLLFLVFFGFVPGHNLLTYIIFNMSGFIHEFNIITASFTLVCLASTEFVVTIPFQEFDCLITERTLFWLHLTLLFVVRVLIYWCTKSTVFTSNGLMLLSLMVFLVCFGHALPTLLALIVLPGTTNVMHSKFADFNWFHAQCTHFCFFSGCFTFHFRLYIN